MEIKKVEAFKMGDELYDTRIEAASDMLCQELYNIFEGCHTVNDVVSALASSRESRARTEQIFKDYEKEIAVVD